LRGALARQLGMEGVRISMGVTIFANMMDVQNEPRREEFVQGIKSLQCLKRLSMQYVLLRGVPGKQLILERVKRNIMDIIIAAKKDVPKQPRREEYALVMGPKVSGRRASMKGVQIMLSIKEFVLSMGPY